MPSRSKPTIRRVETHEEAWDLVRTVAGPTPLEPNERLSSSSFSVHLKREDLGPNGSFKWRGALCAVSDLAAAGADQVVTASTGNHGAATAWAAKLLGINAHVVVPADAAGVKCALIEGNGATLHRVGADLSGAAEHSYELAAALGAPYFEDGSSMAQLLGAGTIGRELAEVEPATVIVPLAVGSLAGGLALGLEDAACSPTLFGVQAEGFDAVARRIRDVDPPASGGATFADGLADNRIVEPAFSVVDRYLAGLVVATDQMLEQAVAELHAEEGIVAEGAGAAALAGFQQLKSELTSKGPVVLLISGRNLDQKVADRLIGG